MGGIMERCPALLLLLPLLLAQWARAVQFDVRSYGARPNSNSDNSAAFLQAWKAACASISPATLYVPKASFMLLPTEFRGPCSRSDVTVRVDGSLHAFTNYNAYSKTGYWLKFSNVKGLTFLGGNLDGHGEDLWACKTKKSSCPSGGRTLLLSKVQNAVVAGITSIDSQLFHVVLNDCTNVVVRDMRIIAPDNSPNTDAIHVEGSSGVTVRNITIGTGDDCISIGPGTRDLWIERVACGPGHGISIGSLAKNAIEEGVQNITVKDVLLIGSDNGLRIKTWARKSNGFVKGVLFDGVVMRDVKRPIIIDQYYCPSHIHCPSETSGIKISDVTYSNVKGTSATKVAVDFSCSPSAPCQGIVLKDVQLTYGNQPATSSCKYASGNAFGKVVPPSCL